MHFCMKLDGTTDVCMCLFRDNVMLILTRRSVHNCACTVCIGMSWCVDRVIIELIRMSMFYRNGCVDISNATMAQRTAITHAIRELAVGIRRQYVLLWDETMNHLLTDSSGTAFGENRSSKYSEIVEEVRYFKDWIFEGSAKL